MVKQIPETSGSEDHSVYRILMVLAAVLAPLYGVVYYVTHPGAVDPLWLRLLISGLALTITGLTFTDWGRTHIRPLYRVFLYLLILWVIALNVWNAFSFDYALGLFFVFTVTSIAFNVGLRRETPLVMYMTFTVVVSSGILMLYPGPETDRTIFITYLVGLPLILYPVARWRLRVERNLRANEERFHVLTDSTFEALLIMEDGRIVDCNKRAADMFAASGPTALKGKPVLALVAPEDVEWIAELQQDNNSNHYRARGQRTNGEVFPAEVRAQPMPYHGDTVRVAAVRDLTAQVEREQQLHEAKEEAEEMNRLKSAFLANMSHEIRTPLTSILGFAEILHEEVADSAGEFVELIQRSGNRLLHTLDSVLALAKLESESMTLDPTECNLSQHVGETAELFRYRADEKNLAFELDMPVEDIHARLDIKAVDRIVSNLLSNAIKFTANGLVVLRLRQEREFVVLTVEDTGKGIAASAVDQLFDAFRQESGGLTRDHEGTGLGLTITHHLVTLMGGHIDVESAPGEGSTFTVKLPETITTETVTDTESAGTYSPGGSSA